MLAEISFKFKTARTKENLRDLFSRQMVMKIFDYLDNPALYQILSMRFYNGITPNWFSQIQIAMPIRLTEELSGVKPDHFIEWEYPTQDYIKGLTTAQKRTLQITGGFRSTDGFCRFNIFISTGEQSKVHDWKKQTVTLIAKPSKVSEIKLYHRFVSDEISFFTNGFEFLNKEGRTVLLVGNSAGCNTKVFKVGENEQVIGIKALTSKKKTAPHGSLLNLQFKIAKII